MWLAKLKMCGVILLAVIGIGAAGVGVMSRRAEAQADPATAAVALAPAPAEKKEDKQTVVSEAVEVNGAAFEVITDKVWHVPEAGKERDVNLSLRITNRSAKDKVFRQPLFSFYLMSADGTQSFAPAWTVRGRAAPVEWPLKAGQSETISLNAKLSRSTAIWATGGMPLRLLGAPSHGEGTFILWKGRKPADLPLPERGAKGEQRPVPEEPGKPRTFQDVPLLPGKYTLTAAYENDTLPDKLWTGKVQTKEVAIVIVADKEAQKDKAAQKNEVFKGKFEYARGGWFQGENKQLAMTLQVDDKTRHALYFGPENRDERIKNAQKLNGATVAVTGRLMSPEEAAKIRGVASGKDRGWRIVMVQDIKLAEGEKPPAPVPAAPAFVVPPGALTALSPDGKTMLVATAKGVGTPDGVVLVDVPSGKQRMAIVLGFQPTVMAVSGNGKLWAFGHGQVVSLHDTAIGKQLRTLRAGFPIQSLSFSADGSSLTAGGADKKSAAWDMATGKELPAK